MARLVKVELTEVCRECGSSKKAFWRISLRTPQRFLNDPRTVDVLCSECNWAAFEKYVAGKPKALEVGELIAKKLAQTKGGAQSRGLIFKLTLVDVYRLWKEQEGRCVLTGHELDLIGGIPYGLSIERIENHRGYTADNIRLVTGAINKMRGSLPDKVFQRICGEVARHSNDIVMTIG